MCVSVLVPFWSVSVSRFLCLFVCYYCTHHSLVLDMLTERRFADRFPAQEDAAIAQLHNIYCECTCSFICSSAYSSKIAPGFPAGDVYCLFSHWWQAANPATIMEFTAVFGMCSFPPTLRTVPHNCPHGGPAGRFHVKLNEYLAQHGVVPPSSWVNSAR